MTVWRGAFNEFSAILKRIFDQSCPFKIMKIKKLDLCKPYITRNIKELIKEKHKMQRLYNKFPMTYDKQYKQLRDRVNSQIRAAKANCFNIIWKFSFSLTLYGPNSFFRDIS